MKHSLVFRVFGFVSVCCLAAPTFAQVVIGPATTAFTDISTTGTSVGVLSDDGEYSVTSAALSGAGWAGNQLLPLTNIRIGNNGAVLWNNTASEVGYVNSTMFPTVGATNTTNYGNGGLTAGTALLCPLWDDHTPITGATITWQVIAGNLLIQWTNEDHFNAAGAGTVTFQLIAYGGATIGSGSPLVDFVYNDTLYAASQYQNDGGSSTIGYKNWGSISLANDVEFGMGGGNDTITDPVFGDPTMKPKVSGYVASNDPLLPHAVRIRGTSTAVTFCSGDAVGTTCVACGNNGIAGNGCANSSFASGALLGSTGNASVGADTLALNCSSMTGPGLFFQANGLAASPVTFGDGMLCAAVGILRLGVVFPVAGAATYPGGLTPNPITVGGGPIVAGDIKHYQCWYRDAIAFCSPSTFNTSNGISVTWGL